MSRLNAYSGVIGSVGVIIAYFLLYYNQGYLVSKFTADFLALIGLSFVSAATLPMAMRALRNGIQTATEKFSFSFWLIWAMVFVHRMWIIYLGILKKDFTDAYLYWYYGPISGLLAVGFMLAAWFAASAPFSGDVPPPRRELITFAIAGMFSGVIAGIAIGVLWVSGWSN